MEPVLKKFVGGEIGLTWNEPGKYDAVTLLSVDNEWFTVRARYNNMLLLHYMPTHGDHGLRGSVQGHTCWRP